MAFHLYVGEAPQGELTHSSCAFNHHVPTGIAFERQGVKATVGLEENSGRQFIRMDFAVPTGKTLIVNSETVRLDRRNGLVVVSATFPYISLEGTPIYLTTPMAQRLIVPLGTPLVGKTTVFERGPGKFYGPPSWDKGYFLSTYIDPAATGDDLWVTLPTLQVNGQDASLPEIHFQRRLTGGFALINC